MKTICLIWFIEADPCFILHLADRVPQNQARNRIKSYAQVQQVEGVKFWGYLMGTPPPHTHRQSPIFLLLAKNLFKPIIANMAYISIPLTYASCFGIINY